jgi:RNA polymerase sigma-70 factor (ECF subfamily)
MDLSRDDLERALAGERSALRTVVGALTPVIQARVARILVRHRSAARGGRDIRQEVEDMTQDVFVALFDRDGRVLRSWDPERGLSLRGFVGLAAERHTLSRLRSPKRNPWTEEPVDGLEPAVGDEQDPPEVGVVSRELFQQLADRLREELTPLGLHLFDLLYLEQQPVEAVCASAGMSPAAVYAWRSRLGKRLRRLVDEIMSDDRDVRRIPKRERP